jgi:hypothetical protein
VSLGLTNKEIELFTWKILHFSDFVFIPTKKKNLSLSEAFWISSHSFLVFVSDHSRSGLAKSSSVQIHFFQFVVP